MDFMSGRVCYKHLKALERHNFNCVTASVDHFEIFNHDYTVDQEITLDSFLTCVGNTTMEV